MIYLDISDALNREALKLIRCPLGHPMRIYELQTRLFLFVCLWVFLSACVMLVCTFIPSCAAVNSALSGIDCSGSEDGLVSMTTGIGAEWLIKGERWNVCYPRSVMDLLISPVHVRLPHVIGPPHTVGPPHFVRPSTSSVRLATWMDNRRAIVPTGPSLFTQFPELGQRLQGPGRVTA